MAIRIDSLTICLHCGCSTDIVESQIKSLEPLEEKYKVYWNNRIDRYPLMYPSYSQLINHSVATSPTEWVILINDRTFPKVEEVEKMIHLLENGFACVLLYNVGFMGFAKELIRKIGWWDERFKHGGWEDVDWVWRMREANLCLYESCDSTYSYDWKSPLNVPGCHDSKKHWDLKYEAHPDRVYRLLSEETYQHWDLFLRPERPEISRSWLEWNNSKLNINYSGPGKGLSPSQQLYNRQIIRKII
jgi:hypothetical protein